MTRDTTIKKRTSERYDLGRNREATATIKGYYYQFDLFILELLRLPNDDDYARLEGIEDIDRIVDGQTDTIQCA